MLQLFLSLVLVSLPAIGPPRMAVGAPQDSQATPRPEDVVKPRTYVSLEPVRPSAKLLGGLSPSIPRGRRFEVSVVVGILSGYHMNAHKTSDEFLIPTTLTAQLPPGFREVEAIYPEGHLKKFGFSDKPLNVYDGSVTLRARFEAAADAQLGDVTIPFTLRYQACNDTTCLPPVKVPANVTVKIVSSGAATHSVHP